VKRLRALICLSVGESFVCFRRVLVFYLFAHAFSGSMCAHSLCVCMRVHACVCVCACVRACARACVRACVRVCARVCVQHIAIFEDRRGVEQSRIET
jgi:hypothetical protein